MSKLSLGVEKAAGAPEPRSLVVLSQGERMLAEAKTLDDLRQIRDLAQAATYYARAHQLGRAAVEHAVELAAVASRRMAELDPPQSGGRGLKASAPADTFPSRQRRSENRDLLVLSEDKVRETVRSLADPSLSRVKRIARDEKARQRPKPELPTQPPRCDIRQGDFREVLADVPDGSVDVILTDPPYPGEYLPLWTDLGAFARRVLRRDGLLVAMSGQLHVGECLNRLAEHLPYRWMIAYIATGHATVVHARRIHSMWKPVLVFGPSTRRLYDLAKSDFAEKRDHEWGQSESGFADLLRLVADPGMTICDPFLGAGTTAVVALRYGCSFVGAEIAPQHYETSLRRVAA